MCVCVCECEFCKRFGSLLCLPKGFVLLATHMAEWYANLQREVSTLRQRGRGCKWCSQSCLSDFADWDQLQQLRRWHDQWRDVPTKDQDIHLLWMFGRDAHSTTAAVSTDDVVGTKVSTSSSDDSDCDAQDLREALVSGVGVVGTQVSTSDASSACTSGTDDGPGKPPEQPLKRRRKYNAGKTRRLPYSTSLLGVKVCERAAECLIRVGPNRLRRIFDGRPDGRSCRIRCPGPAISSVWSFLWTLYHNVAEGLPDKFSFAFGDVSSSALVAKTSKRQAPKHVLRVDVDDEEQTRAIAAHAMCIESSRCPADAVLMGPGVFRGPLRFLHPGKRIHLFWEYQMWAKARSTKVASFSTFLKAFSKCEDSKILKIRNVGAHAVCSTCVEFKGLLRLARYPADRATVLEKYSAHILGQWLDRQVYENATALSVECRRLLEHGHKLSNLSTSVSQLCIAIDGMDQAKFRVPRRLIKSKAFETLTRPALHVHGCWAHGFGYHLAVSDQDCKKDTVSNIEVLSRMLEQIYTTHKGLPLGLHLEQDNCSRECKNQNMLKWAIKLVGLGVFKWITLAYLRKGHTHIDIDGTYGQITVRLSRHEFDDDADVVDLLLHFLGDLGIEPLSRRASLAYKLDEAPCWDKRWADITLKISNITGPQAPHWFKVCRRLDMDFLSVAGAEPFPGGGPARGGDVLVQVKQWMHDEEILQVCTALPESAGQHFTVQPSGTAARRVIDPTTRRDLQRRSEELLKTKHISAKSHDYLVEWSSGQRPRAARPQVYSFLTHRSRPDGTRSQISRSLGPAKQGPLMQLQCLGPGGRRVPLLLEPESCDDSDGDGELVAAP